VASPACLDFIAPVLPKRINRIAQLLNGEIETQTNIGLNAAELLRRLLKDVNCPNGIRGFGLDEKDIPELSARVVREKRLLAQSPRFVTKEDIEEIFRKSLNCWEIV
jgi:alcohol dehydrogenase class IV